MYGSVDLNRSRPDGLHRRIHSLPKVHAGETGMASRPGINARCGVNPRAEIFGRYLFEISQNLRVRADDFGEEIRVGRLGQDLALLGTALTGKVICRSIDECDQIVLRLFV